MICQAFHVIAYCIVISPGHDTSHVVYKYVKTHCCMCWALNKMQTASELVRPLCWLRMPGLCSNPSD
jgi:hypothetical protein